MAAGCRTSSTKLINLLTLCAVLLVVYVNLSWHSSQPAALPAAATGDVSASQQRTPKDASRVSGADSAAAVVPMMEHASRLPLLPAVLEAMPMTSAAVNQMSIENTAPLDEQRPAAQVKPSSRQRIHAVTYASHGGRDDRFCRAVESALRHDIELVILGWGEPWKGLSQKLEASYAYAAALPKDGVMLFTDAFDVMFTNTSGNILSIFEGMNTDILFAGECGCWPHVMEDNGRPCFASYPPAPTPYRYLNSGTWIAKAGRAKDMLLAVIQEAGKNFANANDQKLVADMYIQGRFDIKLDFYSQIFQSMHMTLSKPLPTCDPTKDVRVIDGHFFNSLTHTFPSVFHYNGGGKSVHLKMVYF